MSCARRVKQARALHALLLLFMVSAPDCWEWYLAKRQSFRPPAGSNATYDASPTHFRITDPCNAEQLGVNLQVSIATQ